MRVLERMGIQSNCSQDGSTSQNNSLQTSPNRRYTQLMIDGEEDGDNTCDSSTAIQLRVPGGNGFNNHLNFKDTRSINSFHNPSPYQSQNFYDS